MDEEAADFTRIRGIGRAPVEVLERGWSGGGTVGVVDEEEGCLGRDERLSLRTTIIRRWVNLTNDS